MIFLKKDPNLKYKNIFFFVCVFFFWGGGGRRGGAKGGGRLELVIFYKGSK